jgi:hypothetical protein
MHCTARACPACVLQDKGMVPPAQPVWRQLLLWCLDKGVPGAVSVATYRGYKKASLADIMKGASLPT